MADEISEETRAEIAKRLTLNTLIQGVAAHAMLTAHHLAREEIQGINENLVDDYDRLTVSMFLNIWIGETVLLLGRPQRFWSRTARRDHPFARHRLLSRHGGTLSRGFKKDLLERAQAKRVLTFPGLHSIQQLIFFMRTTYRESGAIEELQAVARRTAAEIWSIEEHRLDATLNTDTTKLKFGDIRTPASRMGKIMKMLANGWGGVERRDGEFIVVAKGMNWPILVHELVKGTAELICLHGLGALPSDQYEQVLEAADHIEYETWQMPTGADLWRRLLALLSPGSSLPEVLMHLARLEPIPLEALMLSVIEEPDKARKMLARL